MLEQGRQRGAVLVAPAAAGHPEIGDHLTSEDPVRPAWFTYQRTYDAPPHAGSASNA